jgi:hypothetical protein
MYVRWQRRDERRRTTIRFVYMVPTADEYAVLVESVRVNGEPRQRHVAYLGSYDDDPRDFIPLHWRNGPDLHYRVWWWHRMTTKLDALGNVIPADQRPRIEAALAKKVPKVSAAEITAFDQVYQEKFRAEQGECRGCYLSWPEGTEGVPPRPEFECDGFARVLAAARGEV